MHWHLLVMLALMVGGCAGTGPEPLATPSAVVPQGILLPVWAVGDYWIYDVRGSPATYVVTEDLGDAWRMDTDSDARAFQDATDDISRLGPQRKSDLAGSQGDDVVEFFHWPLTAGTSWKTTWDKVALAITVVAADAQGADLEGRSANGTLVYSYRYDAASGWFGGLVHWNADGSEQVRLTMSGSGHGWTGNAVRWQITQGPTRAGPPPVHDLVEFDVPEGATDIWVRYRFECGPTGVHEFNLAPRSGEGRGVTGACDGQIFEGVFLENPVPGTWGLTAIAAGASGVAEYDVLVRTKQLVPVG